MTCSQVLNKDEKMRLIENIAGHLKDAKDFIRKRAIDNFSQVDPEVGQMLQTRLNSLVKSAEVVLSVSM